MSSSRTATDSDVAVTYDVLDVASEPIAFNFDARFVCLLLPDARGDTVRNFCCDLSFCFIRV